MPSSRSLSLLCTVVLAIGLARADFIDASVANKVNYDFIVVGGNVVANRLSENPKYNVLVLEAGPRWRRGVLNMQVPFLCTSLAPGTPFDWNFTTTGQTGLGGRSIPYPRGHVLGGSSSINYLVYTRGSSEDYDRYAKVTGDQGWSWKNMLQYFKKNEKFNPPQDGHNTTGRINPEVHGFSGINSQLGGDFKFNVDYNSGSPLGLGPLVPNDCGRWEAEQFVDLLPRPSFLKRPNLHIVVGAEVSRVIKTGMKNGLPVFNSVEYRSGSKGPLRGNCVQGNHSLGRRHRLPHILLNSGIGNSKTLKSNLADHAFAVASFSVTGNNTKMGPMTNALVTHLSFARLDKSILKGNPDPAPGPNSPHYELLYANGLPIGPFPATGNFAAAGAMVLNPTSRTRFPDIEVLQPFDAPIVDPALLKTDFDRVVMREAMKSIKKFYSSSAWAGYVIGPANGFEKAVDDASIDKFIQDTAGSIFHPMGTAAMSPKGAKTGVVDPDLRVKKVSGLRVVDVSVLPFEPSGHTQTPAYVVGERASDLIKAAWQ
ncbi:hypothetical protein BD779DRAFT_1672179 [Infundibulicybe gibba]|nr:hypothetical protein BD779DRAFT_1672179 [Infundibulicybe gibba]